MKVLIDADRCTGHGRCYMLVPSLFDADAAGQGEVIFDSLGDDEVELARSAMRNCPEQAISLVE